MMTLLSNASLRTVVVMGIAVFSFAITLMVAMPSGYLLLKESQNEKLARWDKKVDDLAKILTDPLERTDLAALQSLARTITKDPSVVSLSVYAFSNQLVAQSIDSSKSGSSIVLFRVLSSQSNDAFGRMEIGLLSAQYNKTPAVNFYILIGSLLCLSSVLSLVGYVLVSRLTDPILTMREAIENFDLGVWKSISPNGVKELRQLCVGLNKMAERVTMQATYDPVTGALNRQALENKLEAAISAISNEDQIVFVAFVDLDHFKNINDTYGHTQGDAVLAEIAKRLENVLPHEFTLGRFGGDEFVVFGPSTLEQSVWLLKKIPNNILSAIERPYSMGDRSLLLTASVGTAIVPRDGGNSAAILSASDIALYEAKHSGRAKHVAFSAAHEQSVQHWSLCGDAVRRALDFGEVQHLIQPIVCTESREVWGGESLLRISSEDATPVPAPIALEVAQQLGLTQDLTQATVDNVSHILQQLRFGGRSDLIVTINFSRIQLLESDGPWKLAETLSSLNIPIENVVIEITEESFLSRQDVKSKLNAIRRLGFSLALDDFGSGYSSLACIREIPLSYVKLDKMFTNDLLSSRESQKLFLGTVALLRQMDLTVIAEGIENEKQLDFVSKAGCHLVQGYHLGKPQGISHLIKRCRAVGLPYPS